MMTAAPTAAAGPFCPHAYQMALAPVIAASWQ